MSTPMALLQRAEFWCFDKEFQRLTKYSAFLFSLPVNS
jgi:hypothetical protein